MIYTIEEIKNLIRPIAIKYNFPVIYVFGSYARGEATEKSDIDFLIEFRGSIFDGDLSFEPLVEVMEVLNQAFGMEVDMVELSALEQESTRKRNPYFLEEVYKDRVKVYEQTD
jgi:predicted nucleotidyltransferase